MLRGPPNDTLMCIGSTGPYLCLMAACKRPYMYLPRLSTWKFSTSLLQFACALQCCVLCNCDYQSIMVALHDWPVVGLPSRARHHYPDILTHRHSSKCFAATPCTDNTQALPATHDHQQQRQLPRTWNSYVLSASVTSPFSAIWS